MLRRGPIYSWPESSDDKRNLRSDTWDDSSFSTLRVFTLSRRLGHFTTLTAVQMFPLTSGRPLSINHTSESTVEVLALGQYSDAHVEQLIHRGREKKTLEGFRVPCKNRKYRRERPVWQKIGDF